MNSPQTLHKQKQRAAVVIGCVLIMTHLFDEEEEFHHTPGPCSEKEVDKFVNDQANKCLKTSFSKMGTVPKEVVEIIWAYWG